MNNILFIIIQWAFFGVVNYFGINWLSDNINVWWIQMFFPVWFLLLALGSMLPMLLAQWYFTRVKRRVDIPIGNQ